MNKPLLCLGLLLIATGFLMQYSSLHNVDLSWNAKHIDKIDDNGIIVQDLSEMYQRSMIMLWTTPFLSLSGLLCFIGGLRE